MKEIQSLEKSELLKRTQDLVALERRTTLELIEHLREIERRMLFLELGYSSLFEFSVKHLGLSEGSAQRRISAMRLIRDVPEARAKLETGELTLSNASQVQTAFRAAHMSTEEKKETLEKISGMTQRECQSALLELVPEAAPKILERDRRINEEVFELKLIVSKELHDEIEELKLLLSHTLRSDGTSELIKHLVSEELKRQKKKRGLSSTDARIGTKIRDKDFNFTAVPLQIKTNHSRKHISNTIRREIWKRAEGRCEAMDKNDKNRRCQSRYRLELDHIVPHAQGGSDDLENLRLYCRAHNIKHAIEDYGPEVMNRYR